MEIVDNGFILLVPGAIAAGLTDGLFWWSLILSLAIAFVLTVPVNRFLIARGRGHAVMQGMHAR
jgi:membrane protein implicated in regulation of membrane protease activity